MQLWRIVKKNGSCPFFNKRIVLNSQKHNNADIAVGLSIIYNSNANFMDCYPKLKSFLSKVNFALGRNPSITKGKNYRKFIPEHYKAVIIISADFELAWASRYTKNSVNPYQNAIENARCARENIPIILDLCDKYNIPITWATVGHLFLEECKRENGVPHPNIKRLPHFENEYWKFDRGDWFDNDPCTDWKTSPEWYAPDLIKDIINRKTKHEIACHTFSHIDCRDGVCSSEVFKDEITECQKNAQKYGIKLESFVHPGHTIGNLDTLAKSGFTSFRTDYMNTLGYPIKHRNGLWEFQSTAGFNYREDWSIKYHIWRYKKIINRAVKYNRICYFWFHPWMYSGFVSYVLPDIFGYINSNSNKILLITAGDYVDWLNRNEV